jgi:ribosomal protein S18 acetylase RimI-like enzyme
VQYNDGFYQDILKKNDAHLNKFAFFQGVVVGAICARTEPRCVNVEDHEDNEPTKGERLYIMTLAVMAAYRGRGVGSQLLRSVLRYCYESLSVKEVSLHVQISNVDAIRFYTERFGFSQGELVENYYKRIKPPHCFLLYKILDQRPNICAASASSKLQVQADAATMVSKERQEMT